MKNKLLLFILFPILFLSSCYNQEDKNNIEKTTSNWSILDSKDLKIWKTQEAKIDIWEILNEQNQSKNFDSFKDWETVDKFWWIKKWNDLLNENARFRYYYQITCHHCQTVNKVLDNSNLYNSFAFEKKEITSNKENFDELILLANELWLDKDKLWVPFIYDVVVWDVLQWNEKIFTRINDELSKWEWNYQQMKLKNYIEEQKEITHWEETKNTSTNTKWKVWNN